MAAPDQPLWRKSAAHSLHAILLLKAAVEERLSDSEGLLLADHEALLHLAHGDPALRMSDIADRLVLSRGGATKVIDRLEELGYATRVGDPNDRRATIVEITPDGVDAAARARKVLDAVLQDLWARHVDDSEAKILIAVMERVIGGIQSDG